ncbi:MAG: hypothetical protein MUC97_08420 [Bernardetiaceae bacterium]|nr:hypothetical protein [Bernardetiaceae bacterium]
MFALAQPGPPAVTMVLTGAGPPTLGPSLPLLPDPDGRLTWQAVRQLPGPPANLISWQSDTRLPPQGAYWVKLLIKNPSATDQAYGLAFKSKFYVNYIDLYVVQRGQLVRHSAGGTYRPTSQVTGLRFSPTFTARAGQTTELYLRLQNFYGYPINPFFELQPAEMVARKYWHQLIVDLLIASGFVILFGYNFFLYFIHRSLAYLYYMGYLVGLVYIFQLESLQLFDLLQLEHPGLMVSFYYLVIDSTLVCYTMFINQMNELPAAKLRAARTNRRLVRFTLGKAGVIQLLFWVNQNHYWVDLTNILGFAVQLGFALRVLYHLRQQPRGPVWWVILGTSCILMMVVLTVTLNLAVILGWTQGEFENNIYLLQFGGLADAICFSLALGAKARQTQQREREARNAMSVMQSTLAERLTHLVGQRSEELATANQELLQQKEELTALAENLETLVRQRTADLALAMRQLSHYNEQLAYFSDALASQLAPPFADFKQMLEQPGGLAQGDLRQQAQIMDARLQDLNQHFEGLKMEFGALTAKEIMLDSD